MLPRTNSALRCLRAEMRRASFPRSVLRPLSPLLPALAAVFILVTCGSGGASHRSHVAYVLDLGFLRITVQT
jgi:hypothetical protein